MSDDTVWVRTTPDVEGRRYHVELSHGQDTVLALSPTMALAYADAVVGAAEAADYDAAVIRQMQARFTPPDMPADERMAAIGQLIVDMRVDRPDSYGVGDVEVRPLVGARDMEPLVTLLIRGQTVGQWPSQAAREHAMQVLAATHVAALDSGYLRVLTEVVGIERDTAMAMIDDLGTHR